MFLTHSLRIKKIVYMHKSAPKIMKHIVMIPITVTHTAISRAKNKMMNSCKYVPYNVCKRH